MLSNRSMPRCTVIPELAYPNVVEAADWLCDVFGFSVRLRIANHRTQLNVGDGAVVLTAQAAADRALEYAHAVMVRVEDVDGHHAHAVARGARILRSPADYPYGERQYTVADPGGHSWTFSQSIADVNPEDWGGAPGKLWGAGYPPVPSSWLPRSGHGHVPRLDPADSRRAARSTPARLR